MRCTTTDFGTEHLTVDLPDILKAFICWNQGTDLVACRVHVNHNRRLLWNCLRIVGWCHTWGNIMKTVAHVCPQWPRVLEQMRVLIAFFRNQTWRSFVKKALLSTDVDTTLLDHFEGSIAKWRYETIPLCMQALLRLRDICENHMQEVWFQHAQDKPFVQSVFRAAKDTET